MRMDVNNTKINNPLLAQEIGDFTHDCYGPSRARLFMRQPDVGTKANDPQFLQDLSWIGSHFLLNTSGYYDTDYSKTPELPGHTVLRVMWGCLRLAEVEDIKPVNNGGPIAGRLTRSYQRSGIT